LFEILCLVAASAVILLLVVLARRITGIRKSMTELINLQAKQAAQPSRDQTQAVVDSLVAAARGTEDLRERLVDLLERQQRDRLPSVSRQETETIKSLAGIVDQIAGLRKMLVDFIDSRQNQAASPIAQSTETASDIRQGEPKPANETPESPKNLGGAEELEVVASNPGSGTSKDNLPEVSLRVLVDKRLRSMPRTTRRC